MRKKGRKIIVMAAVLLYCGIVSAATRDGQAVVATVVSHKGDEQILLQGERDWRKLKRKQELVNGDYIRTGAFGGIGILFADQTQIRLQGNSLLKIERALPPPDAETELSLEEGSLWSRVKRLVRDPGHGPRFKVVTRTATIGIRGTDWHVNADKGETTLTVMSGEAELSNDHGSVAVRSGESGSATADGVPTKRTLIDLRERPLISMEIEAEWLDMLGSAREAESAQLKEALTLLRQRDYDAAAAVLKRTAPKLAGRERVLAETALAGADVGNGDFVAADTRLQRLLRRNHLDPEPYLLRVWLASFRGARDEAIGLAQKGAAQFPDDGRFPALQAHLYFVTAEPERMRAAAETAVTVDPIQPFAWHVKGLYHQYAQPDAKAAIHAYTRAVQIDPGYSPSWNNLGLVYLDLADYAAAEKAMQTAIKSDPYSTRAKANHGFLLTILNRFGEAEQRFAEALDQQSDEPYGLLGQGYLGMFRGRPAEGTQSILKATTVYPELPGGSASLAAAYYQGGDYAKARQELENARRLDPDDPVPDVMGSVMAVDNYRAGEAIRLARDGFDKSLRSESFAVDSLANAKNGATTLGNAFSNLGLNEWGGYYTELAFDPYLASGYFYLSQREQFDSERARLGANRQGLLLDPLAASAPTRYYEPFRQPRDDVSLFGQVGSEKGALFRSAAVTFQGFRRDPATAAYFLQLTGTDDEGLRDNSAADNQGLLAQFGRSWDSRQHNLFVELDVQNFDEQDPGTTFAPDLNDESNNRFAFVGVGYQHRLNFNNRVLARAVAGVERTRFRLNDEQLLALSNRDFSLLNAVDFDLETVRDIYLLGLRDVTPAYGGSAPNNPDFAVGAGPGFPGPTLPDTIPAGLDPDQTLEDRRKSQSYALQTRHMLDLDPVEFSYGAEVYSIREDQAVELAQLNALGVACLAFTPPPALPDPPACLPAAGNLPFAFGQAALAQGDFSNDTKAHQLYTQARWKITPEFWAEGGLFYRNLSVDFEAPAIEDISESEVNPRFGIGWRLDPRQWLRLAYQGELLFPLRTADTLAPVATMGLVVPETNITFLEGGPRVKDLQLRWDAEWLPWLFTYLSLERQHIRNFQAGGVAYADGQLRSIRLGTNLLLKDDLGLAIGHSWNSSEDRSGGLFDGKDLVGVPEDRLDANLTWVHPSHVRFVVGASREGERFDDAFNLDELRGYWTVRTRVDWEPDAKHWFLSLGVENLFDKDFELARGFPGTRRFVFTTAEYRF